MRKNTKKKTWRNRRLLFSIFIAAVAVVIISLSLVFKAELTRFWYESQIGDRCENEEDFNSKAVAGEMTIFLKNGYSEVMMRSRLESYGLTVHDFDGRFVHVKVPKGKERKWVCIISENEANYIEWVNIVAKMGIA